MQGAKEKKLFYSVLIWKVDLHLSMYVQIWWRANFYLVN